MRSFLAYTKPSMCTYHHSYHMLSRASWYARATPLRTTSQNRFGRVQQKKQVAHPPQTYSIDDYLKRNDANPQRMPHQPPQGSCCNSFRMCTTEHISHRHTPPTPVVHISVNLQKKIYLCESTDPPLRPPRFHLAVRCFRRCPRPPCSRSRSLGVRQPQQ